MYNKIVFFLIINYLSTIYLMFHLALINRVELILLIFLGVQCYDKIDAKYQSPIPLPVLPETFLRVIFKKIYSSDIFNSYLKWPISPGDLQGTHP